MAKRKVIYTIKNPETNQAYTGYTSSFARRLAQHTANGLLVALKLPTNVPLRLLVNTGKAIVDTFLVKDGDYRGAEKRQISKMKGDGWNMLNKTKGGNGG